MMKSIFLALISICFLASCSSELRIERRYYRDGFYISKSERRTASQDAFTERKEIEQNSVNTEREDPLEVYLIPEDTTEVQQEEITSNSKQIFARVDSVKKEILSKTDSVRNKIRQTGKISPVYNGPVEAKSLVWLQRVAWILFAGGLLLLGLGILWMYLYFDMFMLAFASPFLIGAAFAISLVVMIISIRRINKYADNDTETAKFYRRLRNQAMVIVGLVTLFLLFLVFHWLYLIGGQGW